MSVIYAFNAAENPDHVLEQAKGVYESVIIVGRDAEGNLDYRSSTNLSFKEIYWQLSKMRHMLMSERDKFSG